MSNEFQQCAAETVRIVAALGGQRAGYQREWKQAVRRMVAEVYSAPRVTKALKLLPILKLLPGFALDLSGEDDEGQSWDFTRAQMREKARALVLKTKPLLLIGSPPCTQFCSWQTLNAARLGWTAEDVQIRCAEGGAPRPLLLRALRIPSSRRPLLPARTPGQRNVVATQGSPGPTQDDQRHPSGRRPMPVRPRDG